MSKVYEMVIGLEVHVELKTKSKIFCGCQVKYEAEVNTNCCPTCLGLPGTLPSLNEKVVEFAIKAGIATNCEITKRGRSDRKNYFYPDSPKAYQITQDDFPICHNGYLNIEAKDKKQIGITRIHIEEDAGKLVHDSELGTLIDYNRAGVPLIEIVTEPDFRSEEEVRTFLQKLRATLMYIGVSDCKMNEGSFRCDINLSIREKDAEKFGTRTEIKNLNSFNSIGHAIEYERKRQIESIEKGERIIQETLGFDDEKKITYSMREKEDASDYRYFPDPDLMPIIVDKATIEKIKKELPELPEMRKNKYMEKYGLESYYAERLVSSKERADYFEECVGYVNNPKLLTNILVEEVFTLSNPDSFEIRISGEELGQVVNLLEEETISNNSAKRVIKIMNETGKSPKTIIKEEELEQINNIGTLEPLIEKIIEENKRAVDEYKNGKKKALDSLIGRLMKETKGRANPELSKSIFKEKIKIE